MAITKKKLKEMETIFKQNPNEIYIYREIRNKLTRMFEGEIYTGLKKLEKNNIINRKIIRKKQYYWLKRNN